MGEERPRIEVMKNIESLDNERLRDAIVSISEPATLAIISERYSINR